MRISKRNASDIDPKSIADLWQKGMPKDENRTNEMEMRNFVGSLTDQMANYLSFSDPRGKTHDIVCYDKPLSRNLLLEDCPKLENAVAVITHNEDIMQCSFLTWKREDDFIGTVLFAHPPANYDIRDKFFLFSVLQHELRHAMDFVDNNNAPIENDYLFPKDDGGYEIDTELYSKNFTEVRAHSDQARVLLRLVGRNLAKDAIRNSRFTLADAAMREAMVILIDALAAKDSSIKNVGVGSYAENIDRIINPPAVVVKAEDNEIRQLELHLYKILDLMRFSNFIRKK